jgi:hypothetical protein
MMLLEWISSAWLNWVNNLELSDKVIFIVGTCVIHFVGFWSHNLFLYCCYKLKVCREFMIQPDSKLEESLVWENIRETLFSYVVPLPLATYLLFEPFQYFGMKVRAPLPSASIIIRDLIVALILVDFFGY